MSSNLLIFSGNSNVELSKRICSNLDVEMGQAIVSQFADEESRVELQSNVRGMDVFIIQSTMKPANHHVMEAIIMADACRRASAQRITLVTPYFGYARQERKSTPRTPITAKLVADLITISGVDRVLAVELHTSAIQGFFNMPVDHLFVKSVFADHFLKSASYPKDKITVVSPDAGGVERARAFAKVLECGLAIVDKRRDQPNNSSVNHVIGDVAGQVCVLLDDIIDTGGSICNAAEALMDRGATSVIAVVCHAVMSDPCCERIQNSVLKELIVTDSIPLSKQAKGMDKIKQLSLAELLAKAIKRIHHAESISSLFV